VKKLKKEHYTGGIETSSFFYWSQKNGGISPTPSTCKAEGIFGLGWPDWACYFKVGGAPLTICWQDPATYHEPSVNVNNLGCDPLSTSEP
jgi:hypothetical protein